MYKRKHYGWISALSFFIILSANMYMAYNATQKSSKAPEAKPVFRDIKEIEISEEKEPDLFILPLPNCTVSSPFGNRGNAVHTGVDLAADTDVPIMASAGGTVRLSDWVSGYGYTVILTHEDGYETLYAHCNSLSVSAGATVQQGQEIAKVGSTGNSTGPHLHFEIIKDGVHTDPALYISLPAA